MNVQVKNGNDNDFIQMLRLAEADMDVEKVMACIENREYFALGGIGSSIGEMIEESQSAREIVVASVDEGLVSIG